jgi:hypothetical protein
LRHSFSTRTTRYRPDGLREARPAAVGGEPTGVVEARSNGLH